MKKLMIFLTCLLLMLGAGIGFGQTTDDGSDNQTEVVLEGTWTGQSTWVIYGIDNNGSPGTPQFTSEIPVQIEFVQQQGNTFAALFQAPIFLNPMPLAGVIEPKAGLNGDDDTDGVMDDDDTENDTNNNQGESQNRVNMTWLGVLQFTGTLEGDTLRLAQLSTQPIPTSGPRGQPMTAGIAGDIILMRQGNGTTDGGTTDGGTTGGSDM